MHLRLLNVAGDRSGAAMVEFALLLPVLLLVALGLAQFGLVFYNYETVSGAAAYGVRTLAVGLPEDVAAATALRG